MINGTLAKFSTILVTFFLTLLIFTKGDLKLRNLNKEELTEIFKVAYRNLRGPLFHTKHNVYIKREHSKNCSGEEFSMLKLKN